MSVIETRILFRPGVHKTHPIFSSSLFVTVVYTNPYDTDGKLFRSGNQSRIRVPGRRSVFDFQICAWTLDTLLAVIDLKGLTKTTLMLARPGKAPRKAQGYR